MLARRYIGRLSLAKIPVGARIGGRGSEEAILKDDEPGSPTAPSSEDAHEKDSTFAWQNTAGEFSKSRTCAAPRTP
jgi:hypothetical protein